MAEIPIEKKSGGGIPGWVWLLIALLIAGILLWVFTGDDDRDERVAETPVATQPMDTAQVGSAGGTDGPITDLGMLMTGGEEMVGRQVQLTNVPAGDVPTDAGFWITGENNAREYVVINEVRTPNTPIEGKVDVNPGDRVDIVGTVRSAAAGAPEGAAIPAPTAPLPEGIGHYIEAERVTKTQ